MFETADVIAVIALILLFLSGVWLGMLLRVNKDVKKIARMLKSKDRADERKQQN